VSGEKHLQASSVSGRFRRRLVYTNPAALNSRFNCLIGSDRDNGPSEKRATPATRALSPHHTVGDSIYSAASRQTQTTY